MGRRKSHPDGELVLAALTDADRAVVREWEAVLGLEPGGLFRIAGPLLTAVAALRLAAQLQRERPHLAAGDAIREAGERLGLDDDGELPTHPADSIARSLRRWQAGGHVVRSRLRAAA